MNILSTRLKRLSPKYLVAFEPLINRFAQYGGGSNDDKFNKAKAFASVYEFYIYAFFIGLANNKSCEITPQDKAKDFWSIENWKPSELAEQLIICAIAESDLNMNSVEDMDKEEIYEESTKVLTTIEKFANGGFLFINKKLEENDNIDEDELFFVNLLANN